MKVSSFGKFIDFQPVKVTTSQIINDYEWTFGYIVEHGRLEDVYLNAKYNGVWLDKIKDKNDYQEEMLKLIPEGGNFTSIPKDSPLYVKGMISHVYRRINRNEPAKTIIAAGGGGTWGYHYPENRPLTNRERARIQSFPDDFVFVGNTTEVRRQIGNAVPPVGVHAVANALKPLFTGEYERVNLQEKLQILKNMPFEERYKLIMQL